MDPRFQGPEAFQDRVNVMRYVFVFVDIREFQGIKHLFKT